MGDFDVYYSQNPIEVWDRIVWDTFDPDIAVNFTFNAVFTPLVSWEPLESKAPTHTTGREAIPGHTNHNPIGLRQNYITAAYLDSRERQIVADKRYGAKVQLHKYDELINMWREGGSEGFARGILRQHLNRTILETHELLARDSILANTNVNTYAGGATNFSELGLTDDYTFDLKNLRDIKLRLSVRTRFALQQFGTYANPVPGNNDLLIITTPAVMYDLWDQMDGDWMMNLRDLGDERIINGGVVRYQGFTFVETWDAALFDSGNIVKQVGVTLPITAGDGAPDPDTTKVAGVWMTGQSSAGITHYVQCTDFAAGDFNVGDFVALHTGRTNDFGVTNGLDYRDGKTMILEVQGKDAATNRLTFMMPVMDDYREPFVATPQGGSQDTYYAFITKAQHIHPVYEIGARGGSLFAMRQKVQIYTPDPIDDFKSIYRVSWDEFGGMNKWQGDLQEVSFTAASFANRGPVAIA